MKNLAEERIGFEYLNTLGHLCRVVVYRNNKSVEVLDTETNEAYACRWADLKNRQMPEVCMSHNKNIIEKEYGDVSGSIELFEPKSSVNGSDSSEICETSPEDLQASTDALTSSKGNNQRSGCAASTFVIFLISSIIILAILLL